MYGRRARLTPEQKAENAARRQAKAATQRECQVCERNQSITKAGTLVNHGYTRPGCGWLIGGCMGVGHLPFPETDALEAYLPVVQRYAATQERLAKQPEAISWEIAYVPSTWQRKSHHVRTTVRATFEAYSNRVDALSCEIDAYESGSWPSREWPYSPAAKRAEFDRLVNVQKAQHAADAAHARREEKRVADRIAEGRKLRGVA